MCKFLGKKIIEFNLRKKKQHLPVNGDENKCELSERVSQMLTKNKKV